MNILDNSDSMNKILLEVIGWTGAVLVLSAYFLVSSAKINSKGILYQILNFTGALLLIINTLYLKAYPSAFVNVVWVGIATYYLLKNKTVKQE